VSKKLKPKDISLKNACLAELNPKDFLKLPFPCNSNESEKPIEALTEDQQKKYENSLDGITAIGIEKPKNKNEEVQLTESFLIGLEKLFSKEDNWTFLQPFILSLEHCAKCQNCSEACPVYLASGKQEIYRPIFRSEVLRKIIDKYLKKKSELLLKFEGNDIELNWQTLARLVELAYRCTLCRRCAQMCPLGVDNGLIAHEIRKVFSQELGIAPQELHQQGTVLQLAKGSTTGLSPKALRGIIQFMEEEIEEKTGKNIRIPVDKEGAEVLLIHNSGEYMAWLENPVAFAILFEMAGVSWTLSSELIGYEVTNYGVWYDDVQFARIALKQSEVARNLKVNRIVIGECGHAHKALSVVADRIFTDISDIPRESYLPLVEDIVCNNKIKLNPNKNDFPVTLHDPCNMVRLMGIVEPQRRILRKICPQFREMAPYGVENYCCGGGSGLAIMNSMNFPDWKVRVSGRMKLKQILESFQDVKDPDIKKYVCAPCSNCKGQLRDLQSYYDAWKQYGIYYGGLVELVVNAMADIVEPFIRWEWR
jgi:Fe-S oxidoreductase